MGNSAVDIAVESSYVAHTTYLAARRGAWIVPKYLFGRPSDQLRNELLGAALDVWEAEQGPFTDEELDAAARVLGVSGSDDRRGS